MRSCSYVVLLPCKNSWHESHQQSPKLASITGFGFRPLALYPLDQLRWAEHGWSPCPSHMVFHILTDSPFFLSLKQWPIQRSYYLENLTRLPTPSHCLPMQRSYYFKISRLGYNCRAPSLKGAQRRASYQRLEGQMLFALTPQMHGSCNVEPHHFLKLV